MTIDDELVITVRIRIPRDLSDLDLMGIAGSITGGVVGGFEDHPGKLSGIDITLPTFEPYPDLLPTTGAP
jgi:hypothetical protein